MKYQDRIYEGEHEAIISDELFECVQSQMSQNRRAKERTPTNRQAGILEHLLYCAACDARMSHTYTSKGPCRYRYYVCSRAQTQGYETCPSKSIPAEEIEHFVWGELAVDPRVASLVEDYEKLRTSERAERLKGLVERIEYDGREGDLFIHLLDDQRGTA